MAYRFQANRIRHDWSFPFVDDTRAVFEPRSPRLDRFFFASLAIQMVIAAVAIGSSGSSASNFVTVGIIAATMIACIHSILGMSIWFYFTPLRQIRKSLEIFQVPARGPRGSLSKERPLFGVTLDGETLPISKHAALVHVGSIVILVLDSCAILTWLGVAEKSSGGPPVPLHWTKERLPDGKRDHETPEIETKPFGPYMAIQEAFGGVLGISQTQLLKIELYQELLTRPRVLLSFKIVSTLTLVLFMVLFPVGTFRFLDYIVENTRSFDDGTRLMFAFAAALAVGCVQLALIGIWTYFTMGRPFARLLNNLGAAVRSGEVDRAYEAAALRVVVDEQMSP